MLSCTITHPVVCKPPVVHEASEHGPRDDRNFFIVGFFSVIKRHILKQKINERVENVSSKRLKLSLTLIRYKGKPSQQQDGLWILHPAKVRLSLDLRLLKALRQQMKPGVREAFCSGSALLGVTASFPSD